MTALTKVTLRKQGETTPFCEVPNCRTTDRTSMPSYATVHMFLLGHPIGWYCKKCAADIELAYMSAHGTFVPEELAA